MGFTQLYSASCYSPRVTTWTFLTNQARALLYIAANPDARQRDLGAALNVTERTVYTVVADLTAAGYIVKERDGRRNRYHVQSHLPLPDSNNTVLRGLNDGRTRTVRDLLAVLVDPD